MFAASRKDKVRGRTLILIVSMITRNGFNQWGAPPGNSPASHLVGLNTIADIIKASHSGRPNLSVNNKCLEYLNTAGSKPIKLILIIIINKATRNELNPFKWIPWVRVPCSFIIFIVLNIKMFILDGVIHIVIVNIQIVIEVINQNKMGDKYLLIILTPGSNDEKISNIIKTWRRSFKTLKVFSLI